MALATTGDVSVGGGGPTPAGSDLARPGPKAQGAGDHASGGPPGAFVGRGSADALARSFLNGGQLAYLAMGSDGTLVYASESVELLTGVPAQELVGTNALDWVHPEDAERALLQLSELMTIGSAPGTSLFRLRGADGSWLTMEILGAMVSDGADSLIGITLRDARDELFLEDLLTRLVGGASREEALRLVCDSFDWADFGSSVAISWHEDGGRKQVSTGVPDCLGGADPGRSSPWSECTTDCTARQGTADHLDDERRDAARELGLSAYWVEPLRVHDGVPPATITIWTGDERRAPAIHAYGMGVARNLTEIVLRWTAQAAQLDRAAHTDPLTGVANHKSFFEALGDSSTTGGAVLFCDLDRFKEINDNYGHAAGDGLLRVTAQRLQHCVRESDLVGRLGGDEFAVLIPGATAAVARKIADRILRSFRQPCRLIDGEGVEVGISIGLACDPCSLSEETLIAADRALGSAKERGRGMICVAEVP